MIIVQGHIPQQRQLLSLLSSRALVKRKLSSMRLGSPAAPDSGRRSPTAVPPVLPARIACALTEPRHLHTEHRVTELTMAQNGCYALPIGMSVFSIPGNLHH